jgi:hypothetical protein
MNVGQPPFDDVRVRQALAEALVRSIRVPALAASARTDRFCLGSRVRDEWEKARACGPKQHEGFEIARGPRQFTTAQEMQADAWCPMLRNHEDNVSIP